MSLDRIRFVPVRKLSPSPNNARTHSKKQIRQIADSIKRFGFTNPVLVDENQAVLAGHGRVEAAKLVGLRDVPTVCIAGLTDEEKRAYVLADNRLAEKAGWDKEILAIELQHLVSIGFEVEITGFETPEVDLILDAAAAQQSDSGPEDEISDPRRDDLAVTRLGDIWLLGRDRHRLINGDAREPAVVTSLMAGSVADMVITDPPYNVRIAGHVSGKGRVSHGEFAMASGEMTEEEFITLLREFLAIALENVSAAALLYVFMDWRHLFETMTAARALGLRLINLCVWNKTNGGMGSLYRSKHELVLILGRSGQAHGNNVELGKHGRSRTNVWDYAGVNTFRSERDAELAMHPTVKPVALIADAIRDVTKTGDVILDPFAGSGTTLIAAEKTGRRACAVEIDAHYCDVAILRWQKFTGKKAVLAATGQTFEEVAEARHSASVSSRKCAGRPQPRVRRASERNGIASR